ncbi:MAG: transporter, ATP-binding protein [Bacteroidota bacterium]|jgi:ABC-2 type transport system ATP-binding protein
MEQTNGQSSSFPLLTIFESENLGRRYDKFRLQGVSAHICAGEITGLVGENGSGKTTFLRMIVGEIAHNEGSLDYPQFPDEWHLRKQQIAYIPQELAVWYGTLKENLHYAATLHGFYGSENEANVAVVVARLGLQEHINKRWSELSGGYKLRVALAKALVWQPRLLIIDEPLANLDINTQLLLLNDLRSMSRHPEHPIAVLLSSQHLEEIELYAENVIMVQTGEVVYSGKTADIAQNRRENVYELAAEISLPDLQKSLISLGATAVHNGKYFIITTPVAVEAAAFLLHLLQNGITPHHFKNISQSIKRFFNGYSNASAS